MKKIVILMAAFAFVACSSKPKTDETATTSDVEKKVMEATDSTTTEVAAETPAEKKAVKKAKQAAETNTTSTEVTTGASASSEFGALNGTEKSSVTCTNKNDSRKISVLNVSEGGCGVVYNKMGEDKTVAVAKVDMNYCETVSTKIKTNLEGAGFNCGGAAAAPSTGTSSDTSAQ